VLAGVLGAQDLGPSSDPVVDYFDAGGKLPTDVFSVGPDGQPADPPGADFFASAGRPRDCLEQLKIALRRGIPYSVIQDATRKRFFHYQPVGGIEGFLWLTTPGGVQALIGRFGIDRNGIPLPAVGQMGPAGGIAGDDQPPTALRVLCLVRFACGQYV